jgi:hypothetical protein
MGGRTALQDVGDVGVLAAAHADGAQHRVEQLPAPADEGLALAVLVRTRCFADHQPLRALVADTKNRLGASGMQRAFRANRHFRFQRLPLRRQLGIGLRTGAAGRRDYRRLGRQGRGRHWLRQRRRCNRHSLALQDNSARARHPDIDPERSQGIGPARGVHQEVPEAGAPRLARRRRRPTHNSGADSA